MSVQLLLRPISPSRWNTWRGPAFGSVLLLVVACFEDAPSVDNSGGDASSTGVSGSTTATTTGGPATNTSDPDETTASTAADSGSTTATSSSSSSTSSSESTSGNGVWLCADQEPFHACESYEPEDEAGAKWLVEETQQVTSSLQSDGGDGTHRNYVLNGRDGLRAQTSLTTDVAAVQSLHSEFALRFHTSVDTCSTGTGGDLTVISMARTTFTGSDEQLILQVGPTHATLYSTGEDTTNVITLSPSQALDQWFQVTLDLDLTDGTANLSVGEEAGSGTQTNWTGLNVKDTLDFSFGPASDVDGDTFSGCEFDIDNVILTLE